GPLEAELARSVSGCEIFVAATGDVGIQPDGDRRDAPERPCGGGDLVELFERLHVERTDPGLHGRPDLVLALADAGEDDLARGDNRLEAFGELAARDDVGAEPLGRDDPEDCERVVGLDRVTRQVGDARERLFERPNAFTEAVEVVRVERRPDLGCDRRELVQISAQTCSRSLPAEASSNASWRASTVRSASPRSTKNEILIGEVTMKRASTPISRSVANVRAAIPGWLFIPAPIRLTFASPSMQSQLAEAPSSAASASARSPSGAEKTISLPVWMIVSTLTPLAASAAKRSARSTERTR